MHTETKVWPLWRAQLWVRPVGSHFTYVSGAVDEILPGVFHWKAVHPKIEIEVSSYYLSDSGTLIDPLLPPDGLDRLKELRDPARILLTNRHHLRHSEDFVREFGCTIHCHEAGLHEFEGGPEVKGFSFGDELAPGITAQEVGVICPEETALHISAEKGILSVADGVISYDGLRFVSDQYLGEDPGEIKRGLREAYRRLCELHFDALLVAHGDPIPHGAREQLREFADG
jgi:hypothetical protein